MMSTIIECRELTKRYQMGEVEVVPAELREAGDDEEQAGDTAGVALVSHRFWQTVLGGESSVLGQSLQLDGRAQLVRIELR